ncbi:hypothetical protein F511_28458 [Dorcoceras hygrometricum]|uniref:Uncharacterized protein n=1 Tax=Dorcoceras hygrometricum TaxID=472368 RepID=A0A2Z7C4N0_9LAMI|nr:hypothetical protein F511_28458 [Dorcoceras hygrometricum]
METSKVESVVRNQADVQIRPASVTFAKGWRSLSIKIEKGSKKKMNSRSLDPVVKRNRESAMMTSACLLEKAVISDDDESNSTDALCDGNNQQEATVHPVESYIVMFNLQSQAFHDQRLDNQLLICIQSQDDVPVASYSAPSRRLQFFAYPDTGKADVVKSCNQAQEFSRQSILTQYLKIQPVAKQFTV